MKILFVSHYSFLYGSNRSLDSLIDYFKDNGDNVEVLLPSKGAFYKHLKGKGIRVRAIRFFYEVLYVKWNKKYLSLPLLWLYNLIVAPYLIFTIKKISPDIVYSNSSVDAYSIFFAKLLGLKHVYHVREFLREDFGSHFIFGKAAKRRLILWSNKIIFVSNAVAKAVIGYIPRNGRVIYNGLPLPKIIKPIKRFRDDLRLGVVGNIDISKQQHLAIEYMKDIVKIYPKITLHIIGDKECPYKKYIEKLVRDYHLSENVIFEGFVNDVDDIYRRCDVLLMCSRSEAFGRVTIEAMMRNVPVIGYDSGGTSELIKDGITGFKFENLEGVIAAINTIINDEGKINSIIDNARISAGKNFSEKQYVSNVFNFVHGQCYT